MEYHWIAYYLDGTSLEQYSNGLENSSEKIDRKKLRIFKLFDSSGIAVLTQNFEPGQRLIFRRRVELSPGQDSRTSYLLGWQKEGFQHISVLFEDGRVENIASFQNDNPKFSAIEWLPCEFTKIE